MKKSLRIITLLVAAILATVISGCGETENADKPKAAKVIHVGVQQGMIQPFIAEKEGFFKEEFAKDGIEVKIDWFTLGPPMIEAFIAGSLDFGFLGDQPVYQGLAKQLDAKIIGIYRTSDKAAGIVVREDAAIHTLADLKGKKIAVPFGSNLQPLLALYLQKGGLTDKDVEIVNLSEPDSVTSLAASDVQAAVISEPSFKKARNKEGIKMLMDSEGIKLFANPIIVRGEFANQNPDLTARMLKVFQKAADWAAQHPDEAIDVVSASTKMDKDLVKAIYEENKHDVHLTPERIAALVKGAQQSYSFGLLKTEVDVKKAIDPSYLQKAGLQ